MLIREGEMLSAVSALVSAGRKCVLTREQESAVPVAAAVQVAHDMRDIMEVCAAQLVGPFAQIVIALVTYVRVCMCLIRTYYSK